MNRELTILAILGSLALLQKAAELGVKRFIFASTGGAIYGEPQFAPQTEQHPTNPVSPYGCAKLAVEHYLNYFRVVHGLPTIALRYANVYGPRQNSKGEAGVVAIFADRLQKNEKAIINGDGQQTRDFVYVADVVAANMKVTESSDAMIAWMFARGTDLLRSRAKQLSQYANQRRVCRCENIWNSVTESFVPFSRIPQSSESSVAVFCAMCVSLSVTAATHAI